MLAQSVSFASVDCRLMNDVSDQFNGKGIVTISDGMITNSNLEIGVQELDSSDLELVTLKDNRAHVVFLQNIGGSEQFQRTGIPSYYDIDFSQRFTQLVLVCE